MPQPWKPPPLKPSPQKLLLWALAGLSCLLASAAFADSFSNVAGESFTAQTSRGNFECTDNDATDHRQLLRLNGRTLYKQPAHTDEPAETQLLRNGIIHRDIGCPRVLASANGFVLMSRDLQPPQYQVHGYLLADFNEDDPVLIDLGTGQGPKDDEITDNQRMTWNTNGLALHYFGYFPAPLAPAGQTPKPSRQTTLLSFSSKEIQNGGRCLPLNGIPLFGEVADKIVKAEPAKILPSGLRTGVPKADATAVLERYGNPNNPDGEDSTDLLTIALCGDASYSVMPLFQFKAGRLASIKFEKVE